MLENSIKCNKSIVKLKKKIKNHSIGKIVFEKPDDGPFR